MIVTVEADAQAHAGQQQLQQAVEALAPTMLEATAQAVSVGADVIGELALKGELGITPRHGGAGLAGQVSGWMIDEAACWGAVGVPANSPAIRYAIALEEGRRITPKNARALAVPLSKEAELHSSPRDMEGLELLPREGKPPLLVRVLAKGASGDPLLELHWVLLPSVVIPRFGWFSKGVRAARPVIEQVYVDAFGEWTGTME